ncbi:MAG: ABC transporter ATP-binding protein, partial [Rhodospirillales bacterium]|nr:ABC transporter ATP-binding protein [Rhodospirillales bacterium]
GGEIVVALPQSGPNADLTEGESVTLGWAADQTKCFPAQPSK